MVLDSRGSNSRKTWKVKECLTISHIDNTNKKHLLGILNRFRCFGGSSFNESQTSLLWSINL